MGRDHFGRRKCPSGFTFTQYIRIHSLLNSMCFLSRLHEYIWFRTRLHFNYFNFARFMLTNLYIRFHVCLNTEPDITFARVFMYVIGTCFNSKVLFIDPRSGGTLQSFEYYKSVLQLESLLLSLHTKQSVAVMFSPPPGSFFLLPQLSQSEGIRLRCCQS